MPAPHLLAAPHSSSTDHPHQDPSHQQAAPTVPLVTSHRKYLLKRGTWGWVCVPLVSDSYGGAYLAHGSVLAGGTEGGGGEGEVVPLHPLPALLRTQDGHLGARAR